MSGLRIATLEEVAHYGKSLPRGLLPPIAGATGPALVSHGLNGNPTGQVRGDLILVQAASSNPLARYTLIAHDASTFGRHGLSYRVATADANDNASALGDWSWSVWRNVTYGTCSGNVNSGSIGNLGFGSFAFPSLTFTGSQWVLAALNWAVGPGGATPGSVAWTPGSNFSFDAYDASSGWYFAWGHYTVPLSSPVNISATSSASSSEETWGAAVTASVGTSGLSMWM